MMHKITLVGAGLAGTLCALFLARRGYAVEIFEARSDLRDSPVDYGRSINLALSCRGITGLKAMNLMDEVNKILVPMRARAIHESDGEIHYQPFGRHEKEHINAISRTDLNVMLLNKAQEQPNIQLHFNMTLRSIDKHKKTLVFENKATQLSEIPYQKIIATDGAPSLVREILSKEGCMQSNRHFLNHGYKELSISNLHTKDMAREHLHLWPRDAFLLLGNPNPDDSITGSLFLAHKGNNSFEQLQDELQLRQFFKLAFPDAYSVMPNLVQEFFGNPTGHLSTIYCAPWYFEDSCLLLGDAAHGVIPFFGQGMNSAFEDCRILDQLLDDYQDDWQKVMPAFYQTRKSNTDAIAQMSMDNYYEIHSDIREPAFLLRKQVERRLMELYPRDYISKHILVMFTNEPYAKALAHGEVQDKLLDKLCEGKRDIREVAWNEMDYFIREYDKNLTNLG